MSDGESSHHSCSSLESCTAQTSDVKVEDDKSQLGSEVEH